ncbi:TetR/AcrR family transcriptional regulator [Mycobacterium sp. shizuoka-1]|uniref:TetR/AcrR family transcriptional regulator n=1 Tax=Mycobacterium sp. shizuoka-1 TaxID=2039281 RepID=UPI000C05D19E|nr:TetR/AcrR family transcriptional regulator [Mycobacterium sp. shizuoka-1]GAY13786.1 TetR family transcriptional regulator [Mycobacterium sp. shizuoka-1]
MSVQDSATRAKPGRPRSEQSRSAVVRATSELLGEIGLRAMTVEQIAARSGSSKATIYKWWPNKYAVAVDAFFSELQADSPEPDTGSARQDFAIWLRGLCHFYTGPSGRVFAQLVGEAQFDPAVADELRDRLVRSRRAVLETIWERGVARGELRPDTGRDVAIDLVVGPALYRLMTGGTLDDAAADAIVDAAIGGLGR